MLFLQKIVIGCLVAVKISADDKISFKNVSIQLSVEVISVTSSANLKDVVPPGSNKAEVHGAIPILYENSVADLQDIKLLHIDNVGLREIRPGAFRNLTDLRRLSVQQNNIQVLRENSFSHISTDILTLKFNSITTLEPGVFKHSKINDLFLLGNKISSIPKALFANVTINRVGFQNNSVRFIEDDAFLGIREELKELYLSYNKLEEINPETFNFPRLQVLDLDYNLIEILRPGDLRNLPELKEVNLEGNGLKEIADGVFSNSKIVHLYLGSNKISSVSSRAMDSMTLLSQFDIGFNNLTKWNANWFRNIPSVKVLRFHDNKIEEIPDNAFQYLQNLVYLNLENNKIAKISSILGANFSIETINLSGNEVKCIEGDLEETFRNIGHVDLYGNAWDDSCQNKFEEYDRLSIQVAPQKIIQRRNI